MPQLNGADGDDLGANDELIAFKDEGEREEKRNVSAEGDLDDVKSSLVNESETNSSSDSEVSFTGLQKRQRWINFSTRSLPIAAGLTRVSNLDIYGAHFALCLRLRVQADRRPKPNPDLGSRARHNQLFGEEGKMHSVSTSFVLFCRNY